MDSMDGGASVYSEAKGEYTRQLTLFIVPSFHRFFMGCLEQAAVEEPQVKKQLWKFQEMLSQVPEWNMDKVQREVAKLISEIQCDYLEELVTAVFIAHTKVLTAIRIGNKNKRVQITIPKLEHFVHRSLSECSRLLWSSAYLFHNDLPPMEKQKNHRQIEQLLHEGVAQAIRGLLPVKNILKDYLSEPDAAEDAEDADEDDEKEEKDEKDSTKKSEEEAETSVTPAAVTPVELLKVEDSSSTEPLVEKVEESIPSSAPVEPSGLPTPNDLTPVVVQAPVVQAPVVQHTALQTPTTPLIEKVDTPNAPQESTTSMEPQTLVIQTEPSVRFTNFDQVIKMQGNETQIRYVEKNRDQEEDTMNFLDDEDDGEPLSDFEDLTEYPAEELNQDDFEVLA